MQTNSRQKVKLTTLNNNVYVEIPNFHEKWKRMVEHYPQKGKPGIILFSHYFQANRYAEYLLYRNETGEMVGIITYYLQDYFHFAKAGNINLAVDPKYWRQGIGSKLLKEAIRRWDIDFNKQIYTCAGIKLILPFLCSVEAKSKFELIF